MLEVGLFNLISTDAGLNAIVSGNIFAVLLPQGACLPAVTYQVVSKRGLYALQERVNVNECRMQFDIWSTDYVLGKQAAAALTAAIDNFTGTLSEGTHVFGVQLQTSSDLYESDARMNRVLIEFVIQYADPS